MSEQKHTPEPWSIDPKALLRVRNGDDFTVCSCGTTAHIRDQWEANARRIVACVNACAGVPTHELEQANYVDAYRTTLARYITQRDQLLAALKVIVESEQCDGETVVCDFETLQSVARYAIAAVEGDNQS